MIPFITMLRGITIGDLETTMTRKGQVTIPAEIRNRLGLKPRDRIRFEVGDDEVRIKPARSRLLAGYGAVHPSQKPEDWKRIHEEIEKGIGEEAAAEG